MSDNFIKEIQDSFLQEAEGLLEQTESAFLGLERPEDHSETFIVIKRLAHNFKGSGKAVGFDDLSLFCHQLENLIIELSDGRVPLNETSIQLLIDCNDQLKTDVTMLKMDTTVKLEHAAIVSRINNCIQNKGAAETISKPKESSAPEHAKPKENDNQIDPSPTPAANETKAKVVTQNNNIAKRDVDDFIKLPLKKIDEIFNLFSEQLINLSGLENILGPTLANDNIARNSLNSLKKLGHDIQSSVLSLRMVGPKALFAKLERAIRDSAKMVDKKVQVEFFGQDQELDKTILDQLSDPLTHMVRNSVDHGLESIEMRRQNGKPDIGRIVISAYREADSFYFRVQDDGAGLNPEKLFKKAAEKGLIDAGKKLTDQECYNLIFENGFSTKDQVSELSGRGVGMNVVKETILGLKGDINIASELGKGTTFTLKLPLSLSLFNAILFKVNERKYLIPCGQVQEIMDTKNLTERPHGDGKVLIDIRGDVLEAWDLRQTSKSEKSTSSTLIICQGDKGSFGIKVVDVLGMQKIAQRPLNQELAQTPGASGLTILGDGLPCIILNSRSLEGHLRSRGTREAA